MIRIKSSVDQFYQGFLGRSSIILSGSVLGQGLVFVMLPLLTRIYSADSMGRAASTLAIFNMISVVICLQYDQAIIVAADEEIPYLLLIGFIVSIMWVALLGIILRLTDVTLPNIYKLLTSYGANSLLLLLLASYAPFLLLTQFHLRNNHLSKVSFGRFIYYGIGSVFQVVAGYRFGGTENIFLATQILVAILAIIYLFPLKTVLNWSIYSKLNLRMVISNIGRVAYLYRTFPKYLSEANLANAVSVQLPILFMRVFVSAEWAGWYFLAWRLLATPTTLISQAVGQVFYRDSAEREREGKNQGRVIESVVINLIKVSVLPAFLLGLSAPLLIPLLAGKSWAPVATIIQVLIPTLIVVFFTSPISNLINVKGLQFQGFIFHNLILFARTIGIVAGFFVGKEIGVVWGFTIASILTFLPFNSYIINSFGGSSRNVLHNILPFIRDTILLFIIAIILGELDFLYTLYGMVLMVVFLVFFAFLEVKRSRKVMMLENA